MCLIQSQTMIHQLHMCVCMCGAHTHAYVLLIGAEVLPYTLTYLCKQLVTQAILLLMMVL